MPAFWPNESAIGKRILWDDAFDARGDSALTVVGVVGDVRRRLDTAPQLTVYSPLFQSNPTIVLKAGVDPTRIVRSVREAARAVFPNAIADIAILEQTIDASVAGPRARTFLLDALATLAAVLAFVSVFSVHAFAVARRTNEIRIRMALGAGTGDVMRSVMSRAARCLGAGLMLGLLASLLAARALNASLFQIEPLDPATLLFVALALAAATLVASYLPARRAAGVDPVEALKRE